MKQPVLRSRCRVDKTRLTAERRLRQNYQLFGQPLANPLDTR